MIESEDDDELCDCGSGDIADIETAGGDYVCLGCHEDGIEAAHAHVGGDR